MPDLYQIVLKMEGSEERAIELQREWPPKTKVGELLLKEDGLTKILGTNLQWGSLEIKIDGQHRSDKDIIGMFDKLATTQYRTIYRKTIEILPKNVEVEIKYNSRKQNLEESARYKNYETEIKNKTLKDLLDSYKINYSLSNTGFQINGKLANLDTKLKPVFNNVKGLYVLVVDIMSDPSGALDTIIDYIRL